MGATQQNISSQYISLKSPGSLWTVWVDLAITCFSAEAVVMEALQGVAVKITVYLSGLSFSGTFMMCNYWEVLEQAGRAIKTKR